MFFSGQNLFLIFFIITKSTEYNIDCNDTDLNKRCECKIDADYSNLLLIECSSYLKESVNKLPELNSTIDAVKISNSLIEWPLIPMSWANVTYLDLSNNKIDSIGDVSNVLSIGQLNASSNLIKSIDSSLCRLERLWLIDLSFNLIETFYVDDFICGSSVDMMGNYLSFLEYIYLVGNQIKQIYRIEVMFFSMPILTVLDLRYNQLTSVAIAEISIHSKNILGKFFQFVSDESNKRAIVPLFFAKTELYFFFSNNLIRKANFNFELVYNEIVPYMPEISNAIFFKFMSINLEYNPNLRCDCDLYKDFAFLIDGPFRQSYMYSFLVSSEISYTNCNFFNDTRLCLFDLIDLYKVDVCSFNLANNNATNKTLESEKMSISNFGCSLLKSNKLTIVFLSLFYYFY